MVERHKQIFSFNADKYCYKLVRILLWISANTCVRTIAITDTKNTCIQQGQSSIELVSLMQRRIDFQESSAYDTDHAIEETMVH